MELLECTIGSIDAFIVADSIAMALDDPQVFEIPGSPSFIKGLALVTIDEREMFVPVIDLAKYMGIDSDKNSEFIMIQYLGERLVLSLALISDLVTIQTEEIEELGDADDFFGYGCRGRKLLDVDALFESFGKR